MAVSQLKTEGVFGIGRPIDLVWARYFAEAVNAALPQASFELRKQPGITYIGANDVWSPDLPKKNGSVDTVQAYLEEQVHLILESLNEQGELQIETTTKPIELSLNQEQQTKLRVRASSGTAKLGIYVDDKPIEIDEQDEVLDDYVVEAERNVFTDLFDVAQDAPSFQVEPRHRIFLGELSVSSRDDYDDCQKILGEVGPELKGPVPFLGVSVLRAD